MGTFGDSAGESVYIYSQGCQISFESIVSFNPPFNKSRWCTPRKNHGAQRTFLVGVRPARVAVRSVRSSLVYALQESRCATYVPRWCTPCKNRGAQHTFFVSVRPARVAVHSIRILLTHVPQESRHATYVYLLKSTPQESRRAAYVHRIIYPRL